MVKLLPFLDTDTELFYTIYNAHLDIFEEANGLFYKFEIEDKTKIVYHENNKFIVYYFQENDLYYETFFVGYNGLVSDILLDNYTMSTDENPIFTNIDNHIASNLHIIKRMNGVDVDGYNALIAYSQYNPANEITFVSTWQYMYRENIKLFPYHFQKPFQLTFIQNRKEESFIVRKANKEDIFYEIMLMKDMGLPSYLKNGSLYYHNQIERYYKIYGTFKKDYALTFFPFTKQYTLEELEDKVKLAGFDLNVPEEILDAFNENDYDFQEYMEIAEEIEMQEKKGVEPMQLTLTLKEENNE